MFNDWVSSKSHKIQPNFQLSIKTKPFIKFLVKK